MHQSKIISTLTSSLKFQNMLFCDKKNFLKKKSDLYLMKIQIIKKETKFVFV